MTSLQTGLGERLVSDKITATAFKKLPVIDLTNINGTLEQRKDLARELQKACIECGFFYIVNHGVPAEVTKDVFEQAKAFFKMPLEKKMALDMKNSPSFKGYQPLKGEQVDPNSRGDLHEAFDFGNDSQTFVEGQASSGNQYPSEEDLPGFKHAIDSAWEHIQSLGKRLFPLFALSLNLDAHFFDDKLKNPGSIMRILYYPPQLGEVDPKELGIGAHTDYECFTILAQDENEALQVLNADNEWIHAPPMKGAFVVNIGDQIQRWTNGVYKSTVHRAINRSGVERYSSPFFFGTDYDAMIEVLPSCITPDRPASYAPIKAGEWVQSRLEETYNKA